jgi:hypothetical protein
VLQVTTKVDENTYQLYKQNSSAATNFNTQTSRLHYEDIVELNNQSRDVNLKLENLKGTPNRKIRTNKEVTNGDIAAGLISLTPPPCIFVYASDFSELSYYLKSTYFGHIIILSLYTFYSVAFN